MTKRLPFLMASFVCLLLSVVSCKKKDHPQETPPIVKPFPSAELVKASFEGRVVDESSSPVAGVIVQAGTVNVTTNSNGEFKILTTTINKHAATIVFKKEGFLHSQRTMTTENEGRHVVNIQLLAKQKSGDFIASTGGTITLPGGGTAVFPANAIAHAVAGASYSGNTVVAARYIDPTVVGSADVMPGEPRGVAADGSEKAVQLFSVMTVELNKESLTGEKLNIASGKKVTLNFPIPVALQTTAPATIGLWSLDEANGLWKQEGTATKEGSVYKAEVSHFSSWSVGLAMELTTYKITLKDEVANPLWGLTVIIRSATSSSQYSYKYSNIAGEVQGNIPAGKDLKLFIYDKFNEELYNQAFTSGTTPVALGTIVINSSLLPTLTLKGKLENCDLLAVSNGQVTIELDGRSYIAPVGSDGSFTYKVDRPGGASTSVKLTGYDAEANKTSSIVSITAATGTVADIKLNACDEPEEFVKFTLEGKEYVYLPTTALQVLGQYTLPSTSADPHETLVEVAYKAGASYQPFALFAAAPPSLGTHTIATLLIDFETTSLEQIHYRYSENDMPALPKAQINITYYGSVGDFIIGTFSGQVIKQEDNKVYPVTGRLKVKRVA